jgi:hypothetical protein
MLPEALSEIRRRHPATLSGFLMDRAARCQLID